MAAGALQTEAVLVPEIVQQAQAGDRRAFEQLYRENVGRVFAVCLRMAGERGYAEELTQDAFVRAWEMLTTFRGESAFSSWLHRVAVNVVLVNFRSRKRRDARFEVAEDLSGFEGHETKPPSGEAIDLEKAIARLPVQARTIFVLHDIEGYKHEEIAEMMGLAVGTTKAQLHRARKLLREVLEQ